MYQASITSKEGMVFKTKTKDAEITIGLKGAGITPPDTLLASIGSCVGVYIRKYAEGAKLSIGEFEVIVKGEFSQEKPARFKQIDVSIDLKGFVLDERRLRPFTEFIKNCPVHKTVVSNPVINIDIV